MNGAAIAPATSLMSVLRKLRDRVFAAARRTIPYCPSSSSSPFGRNANMASVTDWSKAPPET
eukprot:3968098-Alexandrium_andersonii.AAC.1